MDQIYKIIFFLFMPFQLTALCITANCEDHSISIIDTSNWTVIKTIAVGKNPRDFAWDEIGKRLFVSNSGDNTISCVDFNYDTIQNIQIRSEPRGIALSQNGANLYVVLKNEDSVSVIDTSTFVEQNTYSVGKGPRSIVLDDKEFYTSNNEDNTISIGKIHLPIAPQPYGLCLNKNNLYVTSIGLNCISVVDIQNNEVTHQIPVGRHPTVIVAHPSKPFLYCTSLDDHKICVIHLLKRSIEKEITVGINPFGLAISPDGRYLLVTNNGDDTLSVIDTDSNTVIRSLSIGKDPHSVLWIPLNKI